ncbi:MAG: hypothetical protein L6Q29_02605 [Candidatus Pacebacteria bacterium]|nr:hypothetical protein [Candidatus Paceibacterota bacterium]
MNSISNYLNKFFQIKPPEDYYKRKIIDFLNKSLDINLKENEINVNFGVVWIKIQNNLLKNEIFLRKQEILNELSKRTEFVIKDIRF